jgi:hypothetical protein
LNVKFLPMTKTFVPITRAKFFKSFAVYSTISELWVNEGTINKSASALPAMACSQAIWVKNLPAIAKTAGNTALWKEVGLLAPQTFCIDAPKLRIEMNQCGKPPGIYMYVLKCGLHTGGVQGLVDQFILDNLPTNAYPQKKTMLANAENPERDVSREPVMGSEMMSVYESRFGINSVSVRSITGPRGSMANPKMPQPAKKKESTLRGMINSAIYQIDQTVYGDNMAGTV